MSSHIVPNARLVAARTLVAGGIVLTSLTMPVGPASALAETGLIPSVATIEDAAALFLNPAGLGTDPGVGMHLASGGFRALGAQSFSLSMGFGAGGFGFRHEPVAGGDRQEVEFATAIPLTPGFRAGLGYRYGRMSNQSGGDYDLGFMLRPAPWLSAGGTVRNMGGGVPGDPRNYQVGLGWRPAGDRVTVSLDTTWAEGQNIAASQPRLGAELEPFDGIFLRAEAAYDIGRAQALKDPVAGLSTRIGLGLATPRLDVGGLGGSINSPALDPKNPVVDGAAYVRFRESRGRAFWHGAGEIVQLRLQGDLGPDRSALNLIAGLAEKPPVASTLEVLEQAAKDPQVRGLAMTIEGIGVSLADLQEVRDAVMRVRAAGKPVVAYLPAGGFLEMYLASAANRILISPVGALDFTGFAIEDLYVKGLLSKIGVKAEFVNTGPFKSAEESKTLDHMSPANREQLTELLTDQFEQIVAAIAAGRRKTPDEIRAQVDRGILAGTEAMQVGLVDDFGNRDDIEAAASKLAGTSNLTDAFKRPVRVRSWLPPRIAVVYASGAIAEGDSGSDLFMGRTLGSDTMSEALKEAREDSQIKAVVLRVDSPGGSVLASEAIRREIERTRLAKPVIVSMGGVAASGGYWIACGTDKVLADPGTITGSIGVIVGKYSVEELLKKNDINVEAVSKGRFAGLGSPFHTLTTDERALLQSTADFTYARFLELVSHARKIPQTRVKELAGGRVYTGSRALQLGLIDREGGLIAALEEARISAGIAQSAEIEIAYMPEQRPFLLSNEPLVMFDTTAQVRKALDGTRRWTKTGIWLLDPRLAP